MSDDEQPPESSDDTIATSKDTESANVSNQESLTDKFRLTGDEEILKDVKPSFFAFIPMYLIALLVLGAHLLFAIDWDTDKDSNIFAKVMVFLI